MRNTQTREGFEFWDKLNALPRYAFLLSPSGKSVQKFEDQAMGNWVDVHEAQKVVDQAQEVISELRDEIATSPKPDPVLCKFYDVTDWPGLVRELVGHVAQLQESAKRNVKPWEDTFPPTLLPAYIERVNAANAADQPQDVPLEWGAPKTVRQLIRQLETLDQDLRPLSMLRVPASVFEDGKERVRATHLSFSHERVDGQWLAPFKSDGEKVLAFWCRMEQPAPVMVVPDGYCIMPRQLTAENGAKALLLGEFKLLVTKECPECCELEEPTEGCSICDGEGEYGQKHTIPWDQIKYIYSKAVSGLAVKTESAKSR